VVLVIGAERLYADICRDFAGTATVVVALNKSGGVVAREPAFREKSRQKNIHAYFYGRNSDLNPFSTTAAIYQDPSSVTATLESGGGGGGTGGGEDEAAARVDNANAIRVFTATGMRKISSSALPVGIAATMDPLQIDEVVPSTALQHSLVAVLGSQSEENDVEMLRQPVMGYAHITQVNVEKGLFTILAPAAGKIPSKKFLLGSIKWLESR